MQKTNNGKPSKRARIVGWFKRTANLLGELFFICAIIRFFERRKYYTVAILKFIILGTHVRVVLLESGIGKRNYFILGNKNMSGEVINYAEVMMRKLFCKWMCRLQPLDDILDTKPHHVTVIYKEL